MLGKAQIALKGLLVEIWKLTVHLMRTQKIKKSIETDSLCHVREYIFIMNRLVKIWTLRMLWWDLRCKRRTY